MDQLVANVTDCAHASPTRINATSANWLSQDIVRSESFRLLIARRCLSKKSRWTSTLSRSAAGCSKAAAAGNRRNRWMVLRHRPHDRIGQRGMMVRVGDTVIQLMHDGSTVRRSGRDKQECEVKPPHNSLPKINFYRRQHQDKNCGHEGHKPRERDNGDQ